MSNLSDLLPAGASGKKATFTASGAIAAGDNLVINTDGTVSVVSEVSQSAGSSTNYYQGITSNLSVAYDSVNQKIVIFYRDGGNNNYGTAIVGTPSGTTISFGTPVVFESSEMDYSAATFDPDTERVVVAFRRAFGSRGECITGAISGTTISFANRENFNSSNTEWISICYDTTADRIVIGYRDVGASNYPYAIVGQIASNGNITFGSEYNVDAVMTQYTALAYDSALNKVAFFYKDLNTNYSAVKAATVTGGTSNSITFGTKLVFTTDNLEQFAACYNPDTGNSIVLARDTTLANYPCLFAVDLSGPSVAIGRTSIQNAAGNYNAVQYDLINQVVVATVQSGSSIPTAIVVTDNDNFFSIGTATSLSTNAIYTSGTGNIASAYNSTEGTVTSAYVRTGNRYGDVTILQPPTSTALPDNFVGIAEEAISNASTGEVVLAGGTSGNARDIVVGKPYYLTKDGALTTTPTYIAVGEGIGASTVSAYNLEDASFSGKMIPLSEEGLQEAIFMSTDGTKFYTLGRSGDTVYQYTLSTAYDISTATYDSVSLSVNAQDSNPQALTFKPDGTKMYMGGYTNDSVYEYALSTAWNLSTASYTGNSVSVVSQISVISGIAFNSDGTRLFITDESGKRCAQFNLSIAYSISTASYSSNTLNFSSSPTDITPQDLGVSSDNKKLFFLSEDDKKVVQYNLTTANDLSTAEYSGISYSLKPEFPSGGDAMGLTFSNGGKSMYVLNRADDSTYQYNTEANVTNSILLNG